MNSIIQKRLSPVFGSKIMEDRPTRISENSKVSSVTTTERSSVETDSRDSLSTHKNQNDQLVTSAKAELEDVREENGRLKLLLTQIMKDCQSLQEEKTKKYEYAAASSHKQDDEEEPDQLVALSLGRCSLPTNKHLKANNSTKEDDGKCNEGLALRLDGKYDSSDYSNGVSKKDNSSKNIHEMIKESDQEPSDTCSPKKYSSKKARSSTGDDDEEVIEQNPTKKARVSVRAICSAPTMNDGCQWRKYGQKISKGNPCPRAYYRCTVSSSCPVRKHVQRCAEDLSILVTTYEGTHNHPLPPSATAMASTTAAAVNMLRSSSTTSHSSGLGDTTTTANIHGLNLINTTRPSNIPYYIPNTTSTISSTMSQLHQTITLDLTTPTASSYYNKYASTFAPAPKYSPPCLNFSAANSLSSTSLEYWGALNSNNKNNLNGCSSYAGLTQAPTQSIPSSSFYQPYYNAINMPTNNNSYSYDQPHARQIFTDKIAAVTTEITSNPSFQSALAAAITSIVGKRPAGAVESSSNIQKVMSSSYTGSVGCATSYLNRSVVPSNSQQGNLAFSLPPVFPFSSNYKGPFVPDHSADNGEQNK